MQILITYTSSKTPHGYKTGEIVREVNARRLLNGNRKNNAYIAEDGECIVREFVVELDDYSDEDIKEYDLIRGTHE